MKIFRVIKGKPSEDLDVSTTLRSARFLLDRQLSTSRNDYWDGPREWTENTWTIWISKDRLVGHQLVAETEKDRELLLFYKLST